MSERPDKLRLASVRVGVQRLSTVREKCGQVWDVGWSTTSQIHLPSTSHARPLADLTRARRDPDLETLSPPATVCDLETLASPGNKEKGAARRGLCHKFIWVFSGDGEADSYECAACILPHGREKPDTRSLLCGKGGTPGPIQLRKFPQEKETF